MEPVAKTKSKPRPKPKGGNRRAGGSGVNREGPVTDEELRKEIGASAILKADVYDA